MYNDFNEKDFYFSSLSRSYDSLENFILIQGAIGTIFRFYQGKDTETILGIPIGATYLEKEKDYLFSVVDLTYEDYHYFSWIDFKQDMIRDAKYKISFIRLSSIQGEGGFEVFAADQFGAAERIDAARDREYQKEREEEENQREKGRDEDEGENEDGNFFSPFNRDEYE